VELQKVKDITTILLNHMKHQKEKHQQKNPELKGEGNDKWMTIIQNAKTEFKK
jgi:hypothetical protein